MRAVAAQGDGESFAALFRHFAPRVKGFLVRSGTPAALAEDLTQEAMVLLWRHAATYEPSRAAISTWLFTIVRNVRIDHHRRKAAEDDACQAHDPEAFESPSGSMESPAGPDELAQAAQREHGVRRALAQMPAEQALVLQLSYFEDQPHSAIASRLCIPLGTVKTRLRAAMTSLRSSLVRFVP
jgi:RNA polymerase sigma-70 factor (ECF subfamily)